MCRTEASWQTSGDAARDRFASFALPAATPQGTLGGMSDVTRILDAAAAGDRQATSDLLPLVYDELRKLAVTRMAAEAPGHTLDATALVHEAYLRLAGPADGHRWESRGHFFAAAAEAMRRILIDRARHKKTAKAGGRRRRVDLSDAEPADALDPADLLDLDDALTRLERQDKRKADVVKLRFFAGFTVDETAQALGIAPSTADDDWAYARAWLRLALDDGAKKSSPASGGRPADLA